MGTLFLILVVAVWVGWGLIFLGACIINVIAWAAKSKDDT